MGCTTPPGESKARCFTKFQFQVLLRNFDFGSHALNKASLFVLKRTQTQTPSLVMLSCKSWRPRRFKTLVDSHSAKTDSFDWNSLLYRLYYRCQKGLSGVHSDKSASNICKLRQWRSQQPSCLPYIVLDGGSRMQCHCNMRRIPCSAIEPGSNTDSMILKAPLLQESAVFACGSHALNKLACLSSKGPKPHHLWCSLANHSVRKNSSPWWRVIAPRQTRLIETVSYTPGN